MKTMNAGSASAYGFLALLIGALLIEPGCAPTGTRKPAVPPQSETTTTVPISPNTSIVMPPVGNRPILSAAAAERSLQQIEDLIFAGDTVKAQSQADAVNFLELSTEQQMWLILLRAQIYLSTGNAELALKSLAAIMPEYLDIPHKIELFKSRAFAFSLAGNPLESAKARMELNDLLSTPEQRRENQAAILESLTVIADSQLTQEIYSAPTALAGWLELAKILKLKNQAGFNEQLAQWRLKYPGHPANSVYLDNLSESDSLDNTEPGKSPSIIALFLPGSGPYAQAGNAIRAGFTAALEGYGKKLGKPDIKFYDTAEADAAMLYNQALANGAQVVIGPLEKQNVQKLAASPSLPIPVLALNQVPGVELSGLYQFGLSPADDVEEIIRKAWSDGRRQILLLLPESAQNERIAGYFNNDWQNLGGTVLEMQRYNVNDVDFSNPIKKLLNVDESESRFNNLRTLVTGLHYTPRARQDAEAIMLYPNSKEARLLNPQLRYYAGGEPLPVYATSSAFNGQADGNADSDLDNVIFCDAPWMLEDRYLGALSKSALQPSWQGYSGAYLRLFAMGIDAYLLAAQLYAQNFSRYGGATGELTADTGNHIKRHLACAKFAGGLPQITDPIEASTKDDTTEPPVLMPYHE